jgi:hypothetical protein
MAPHQVRACSRCAEAPGFSHRHSVHSDTKVENSNDATAHNSSYVHRRLALVRLGAASHTSDTLKARSSQKKNTLDSGIRRILMAGIAKGL